MIISNKGLIQCHFENCWQNEESSHFHFNALSKEPEYAKELMKFAEDLFLESIAIQLRFKNNKWLGRIYLNFE